MNIEEIFKFVDAWTTENLTPALYKSSPSNRSTISELLQPVTLKIFTQD